MSGKQESRIRGEKLILAPYLDSVTTAHVSSVIVAVHCLLATTSNSDEFGDESSVEFASKHAAVVLV